MSEQPYTLYFTDRSVSSLKNLDRTVARRIVQKLEWLADNAAAIAHTPLTGDWQGYYRLRVGDYRVIYRLDHSLRMVVVEIIGHRSEIYDRP